MKLKFKENRKRNSLILFFYTMYLIFGVSYVLFITWLTFGRK